MAESRRAPTKTDRMMEDRMLAVAGDKERVEVLSRARLFKSSWIDLAEALTRVREAGSWEGWGFDSFEAYCKNELHLTPGTTTKLLGSYTFLRSDAPRVIERARSDPKAVLPSLKAVEFVQRASDRGAADAGSMREIRQAAFDEGAEAPLLSRRFREVAFPVDEGEREDRLRTQLLSTARRLAQLLAQPRSPVPRRVAITVEAAVGELLAELED